MLARVMRGVLLLLGLSVCALGQKPVQVGIPTAQFNFVSAAQLHTDWCWAASVQMVLNWYKIPVKQSDVVNRILGKPVDATVSEDAIAVALSGTAWDRSQHEVHMHADRLRGTPASTLLVAELSAQHPMLITFHSAKTMLHAVVLTAAEYVRSPQGPRLTALTFRDPSPNFKDRRTAEAFRVTGAELQRFLGSISSYYLFKVQS